MSNFWGGIFFLVSKNRRDKRIAGERKSISLKSHTRLGFGRNENVSSVLVLQKVRSVGAKKNTEGNVRAFV